MERSNGPTLRARNNPICYKETATKRSTVAVQPSTTKPIQTNNNSTTTDTEKVPASKVLLKRPSTGSVRLNSTVKSKTPHNPLLSRRASTVTVKTPAIPSKRPSTVFTGLSSSSNPPNNNSESIIEGLTNRINQLEDKFVRIEERCTQLQSNNESLQIALALTCQAEADVSDSQAKFESLTTENTDLKSTVEVLKADIIVLNNTFLKFKESHSSTAQKLESALLIVDKLKQSSDNSESQTLRKEVDELKSDLNRHKENQLLAEKGISREQQEINTNIVIRGIHVEEKDTDFQPNLIEVYDNLRTHLGISEVSDLKAVSATILQQKGIRNNKFGLTSAKTIQVKLKSVSAKRKLLQIRRVKKDILPIHIGITQTSKKPILITEQLTKENQELLFKARSLRTTNKFKFVWSNDGQILARQDLGSKVIRIRDTDHINSLRSESLVQQQQNGQLHTNNTFTSSSGDT